MGHAHFEEVAHHVELMVDHFGVPGLLVQRVEGMNVTVGRLRGEDGGNPLFKLGAKLGLRAGEFGVAVGMDGQREANGLDDIVNVGIAPRRAGVFPLRLVALLHAGQGL